MTVTGTEASHRRARMTHKVLQEGPDDRGGTKRLQCEVGARAYVGDPGRRFLGLGLEDVTEELRLVPLGAHDHGEHLRAADIDTAVRDLVDATHTHTHTHGDNGTREQAQAARTTSIRTPIVGRDGTTARDAGRNTGPRTQKCEWCGGQAWGWCAGPSVGMPQRYDVLWCASAVFLITCSS